MLQPGQVLYFETDPTISAIVLANGQIKCGSLCGSIHFVAKSLYNGAPSNGWDCWLYEFQGNRYPINTLRQKIQEESENDRENKEQTQKD